MIGSVIGPYRVVEKIGAGGMGEVYLATDTNLGRQVAIKVVPASLAADPERLARFDREARTLAAINHPNIAAIYGVERAAHTTALVMELVEGPTLAERIAQGPMTPEDALPIARQIAAALVLDVEPRVASRETLFQGDYAEEFDIAPDGRFLMIENSRLGRSLVVVPAWRTHVRASDFRK